MGWIELLPYFCTASETARDVASQYAELPVGDLQSHPLTSHTIGSPTYNVLPEDDTDGFHYLIEVYVDDFIGLAIPTSRKHLDHIASAVMYGIHDVFPPAQESTNDPISEKKLLKGKGQWATIKEVLGLTFDGAEKTIWLSNDKQDALIGTLKRWMRVSACRAGVPFSEFESTLAKLQHAFLTIPTGRGLL
jgi:hypothetical protein